MAAPPIPRGTTLMGLTLLGVALAFAGWRSTSRPTPISAALSAADTATGAAVWASECASCHGDGEARGGFIPALHGLAVDLLLADGGRDSLIDFLLDGRIRRLRDGEVTYGSGHPVFDRLSDTEAAAVLNHMLLSWGNAERLPAGMPLYSLDDVAARRPLAGDR